MPTAEAIFEKDIVFDFGVVKKSECSLKGTGKNGIVLSSFNQ